MDEQKKFLTVDEFAKEISVTPTTVRRMLKKGLIQKFRTNDGPKAPYRIPAVEAQRLCELDMTKLIEKIVKTELEKKNGQR